MRRFAVVIPLLALILAGSALAEGDALDYQMPAQVLADIIDAPPTPGSQDGWAADWS